MLWNYIVLNLPWVYTYTNTQLLALLLTTNFLIVCFFIINFFCPKKTLLFGVIPFKITISYVYATPVGLENRLFLVHPLLLITCILMLIVYNKKLFFLLPQKTIIKLYNNKVFFWLFVLLVTIWMGGYWAQQEFNWGGWWSWDTVEVTSIFILLTFLIWIHMILNIQTQSIRVILCKWILIVHLVIYGINRLNLFTSIHSFNSAHTYIYNYIFIFFIIMLVTFYSFQLLNIDKDKKFFFIFLNIWFVLVVFYVKQSNIFDIKWFENIILFYIFFIIKRICSIDYVFYINLMHKFIIITFVLLTVNFNFFFKNQLLQTNNTVLNYYVFNTKTSLIFKNKQIFYKQNLENFIFFKPTNTINLNILNLIYIPKQIILNFNTVNWFWF